MANTLTPESHFPNTDDISEVCQHAFQSAVSMHADGEEGLIRIISDREVIGRQTQDRRQILIYRDAVDAETLGEELYELEILKPPYVPIDEESDDPDRFLDKRLFVTRSNPYEFFEADEDGHKNSIGREASKRLAESIVRSNMTTVPGI